MFQTAMSVDPWLLSALATVRNSGSAGRDLRRLEQAAIAASSASSRQVTAGDTIGDLEEILDVASKTSGITFSRAQPLQQQLARDERKDLANLLKKFAGGRNLRCHPERKRVLIEGIKATLTHKCESSDTPWPAWHEVSGDSSDGGGESGESSESRTSKEPQFFDLFGDEMPALGSCSRSGDPSQRLLEQFGIRVRPPPPIQAVNTGGDAASGSTPKSDQGDADDGSTPKQSDHGTVGTPPPVQSQQRQHQQHLQLSANDFDKVVQGVVDQNWS